MARQGNPKLSLLQNRISLATTIVSQDSKPLSSISYAIRLQRTPNFIEENKNDLAASLEATIIDILMKKLKQAAKDTGIKHVALAGGVSANSALRKAFQDMEEKGIWKIYIPKFSYTTDNAAMIAMSGHYRYLDGEFCSLDKPAFSRTVF